MKYFLMPLIISAVSVNGLAQQNVEVPDTASRVQRLDEVVVKADNITVTPDKMIVRVDRQVKRHAYDGYSALSLLMIPGLDVSVFDHTVSTFGQGVLLLVNGMEATTDEIKTLNPKDIKRVDYYTNFDPRYPTKQYVLDFIMVVRDSGGAVMLQANKQLNRDNADGLADWRMFNKKSEFGVRASGGIVRNNESFSELSIHTMQFPEGQLTQLSRQLPSQSKSNSGDVKLSYLYRFSHGVLKSAVSMGSGHAVDNSYSEDRYSGIRDMDFTAHNYQHRDQLYPSFSLQYDHKFPSKVLLSFSLKGGYTRTEGDGLLQEENRYVSLNHENYVKLTPRVKLTVPIGKKVSSYASMHYFYDNSRQRYIENERRQDTRLINGQALVEAGANYKMTGNTSFTLRLQERIVTTDAGYGSWTNSYFTPGISMSHRFMGNNRIGIGVFSGVYDPQLQNYSTDEKQLSDYLIRVGNPDLKLMRPMSVDVQWVSAHKWGAAMLRAGYENTSHSIISDFNYDAVRNVYVWSFYNGGHYEALNTVFGLEWNVLPERLKLAMNAKYDYYRLPGYVIKRKGCASGGVRVIYMQGGFSGELKMTTQKSMLTRTGSYHRLPLTMDISLGYAIDGWSVNLMARNPFIKVHITSWSQYGGWTEWFESYSPKSEYNMFQVKVSYRFNYGKKHKFDEVNIDSAPKSAIL